MERGGGVQVKIDSGAIVHVVYIFVVVVRVLSDLFETKKKSLSFAVSCLVIFV